jgi:hypothetical protein
MSWVAASVAAGATAFKGISGAMQVSKGKNMAKNNIRPIYTRPNEVSQGLSLAEKGYENAVMPGTSQAINNISATGAAAFGSVRDSATNSGDVLDAITKVNFNQGQQFNDLASRQALYKQQQLGNLQAQLANSAQYGDKEFSYNKDQPYQDTAAAASALIGAGNQNLGSAVNELGTIGTAAIMNQGGDAKIKEASQLTNVPPMSSIKLSPGLGGRMVYDHYTGKLKFQ